MAQDTAPKFDRTKFKPTKLADFEKQEEEIKDIVGSQYDKRDGMVYHSYKDNGKHTFRLFPAHPDSENQNFLIPKFINPLEVEVDEYDKGEKTGKKTLKRKNIFNAKVHGGASIDLVEEYIKMVEKKASEKFKGDQKRIKEYLLPVYGQYVGMNNPGNIFGIRLQESYICYANRIERDKEPIFGRLELTKGIRGNLKTQAALLEDEDDPIGTEPYTDVEEGRNLIIFTDSTKKGSERYTISTGQKSNSLSDEQLEAFMSVKSLENDYTKCFKRKDLDLQIEGLLIFDDKNRYSICETEDFLELVESLQEYWPEDSDDDGNDDDLPFYKNGKDKEPEKIVRNNKKQEEVKNQKKEEVKEVFDREKFLDDESEDDDEDEKKHKRLSTGKSILDKYKKK
jgi:hypothetical protein